MESKGKEKKSPAQLKMQEMREKIAASTQRKATQASENPDLGSDEHFSNGVMFIDNASNPVDAGGSAGEKDKLVMLDPSECYVIKQVREEITETDIRERRLSIEAHGQMKPIEVFPRDQNGYQIITGEVRWRACSIEPVIKIQAIIRYSLKQIAEPKKILKQVAENTEAVRLSIYEIANSLRRAMEAGKIETHEALAREMGWFDESRPDHGRSKVSQYLALFNLCERGQDLYKAEKISDVRAIKILSSIRGLSQASYNAILTMIENGETVTRKMMERERDKLKDKTNGDEEKERDKKVIGSEKKEKEKKAGQGGQTTQVRDTEREQTGKVPEIYFTFNRKLVRLVYKEAPANKLYCVVVGDETNSQIIIDAEEAVFSHFRMPS